MMTTMRRGAATVLLMATPLGLAACGSESKPSKADVQSGMSKMMLKDVSDKQIKGKMQQLINCMVDQSYPKLSTKALKAIAKGDEKSKVLTTGDNTTLNKAEGSCEQKVK